MLVRKLKKIWWENNVSLAYVLEDVKADCNKLFLRNL